MSNLVERLRHLSKARWDKDAWEQETTVRIPAEPDRDIDLVLAKAADKIEHLSTERDALADDIKQEQAWRTEDRAKIERLRAECDAERQEKDALANEVVCLRNALRTIANRECANEDECAALANRCLRQIEAAMSGKEES